MKTVTTTISTIYVCDIDGTTTATVSGTGLPSGWKRAVVPVTPAERVLGLRPSEKHIGPPSLASSDPAVLAQIKALLLP